MYFVLKSMIIDVENSNINEIEETLYYEEEYKVEDERFDILPDDELEVEQFIMWRTGTHEDVEYTITKSGNIYRMYEEVFDN